MSTDSALGLNFNLVQCYFFLAIMAHITGLKPGIATHHNVNIHIYEDHFEGVKEQLTRTPYTPPSFSIPDNIKTLEDVLTWVTADDFTLTGYEYHPAIKYDMSV